MPERQELPLESPKLSHTSQAFVEIAIERNKVKISVFFKIHAVSPLHLL